tara:strand:+ start:36 stop:578 length:543 start_codon:yes stop_codon:yes gene_type:complete
MAENPWGKFFALVIIVCSGFAIIKWKEYEKEVLTQKVPEPPKKNIQETVVSNEISASISLLEKMALLEREKIRVMVEHDNSPLTSTYPMILDATTSYDPDVGDEIQYVWKQISGPSVDLKPNPFVGKVSFEGEAGEYTFELSVSDNYGAEATVTRTVVIQPEPNTPPVIDMKVRQGSELN